MKRIGRLAHLAVAMLAMGSAAGITGAHAQQPREVATPSTSPQDDVADAVAWSEAASKASRESRHDDARDLYWKALRLRLKELGPDHIALAQNLMDLGRESEGESGIESERLYARAAALRESQLGLAHALTLKSLARLAYMMRLRGRYDAAETLQLRVRAAAERVHGAQSDAVAAALDELAMIASVKGENARAKLLLEQSLDIRQKIDEPGKQAPSAGVMVNLGRLYVKMGSLARAEPLLAKALEIREAELGTDALETAYSYEAMALLYARKDEPDQAEAFYKKALAIMRRKQGAKDRSVANTLRGLGELYVARGDYAQAEPLLVEARGRILDLFGKDHPNTMLSLRSLATLHLATGRLTTAQALAQRLLTIVTVGGNPERIATASSLLARVHYAANNRDMAIFYGQRAVAASEEQRVRQAELDPELQETYLRSRSGIYRELAGWLIEADRVDESEHVFALLRGEELRELTHSAHMPSKAAVAAPCHGSTCSPQQEYGQLAGTFGKIARELEAMKRDPDTVDEARRASLLAQQQELRGRFEAFLGELPSKLAAGGPGGAADRSAQSQRVSTSGLSSTLFTLGRGTVALRYLVFPDRLFIVLVTGQAQRGFTVPVAEQDLDAAVQALRHAVLARGDVQTPSRRLYEWLIAPVAQDLADLTAGVEQPVLMIAPDKSLGLLPFAALHDGKRYLVERFALGQFSDDVRDKLALKPTGSRGRAFGLTQAHAGLPALPAVRDEVAGVQSAVGGEPPVLDALFTEDSLRRTFDQNEAKAGSYPIVHLASHFTFHSGDENTSGLVLGDGKMLNLMTLKGWTFNNTELLTLSACQTAEFGGTVAGTDNRLQVDGFAHLAQYNGAHAVLATLWTVNDASTGQLMRRFYALRYAGNAGVSKAEALRRAQVELLTGSATDAAATQRGAVIERRDTPASLQLAAAPAFAHPYYWAPFTLIGNWQ